METPFTLPGFEGRRLVYRSAGFIMPAQILVDGVAMPRKGRVFTLKNDSGQSVDVRAKSFFDPIPALESGGLTIQLAPPLQWYEYCWAGAPLILIILGGLLGGLCGGLAAGVNLQLFRRIRSTPLKFAVTGMVSFLAFVVYAILAVLVLKAFNLP